MNQISKNYAKALYELGVSKEAVEQTRLLIREEALMKALKNPVISKKDKHKVIERIFPKEMHNFLKLNNDYNSVQLLDEIFEAYDMLTYEMNSKMKAELICVEAPDKEQEEKMKEFIIKEYGVKDVILEIKYDKTLIAGFILKTQDKEYDYSVKGRMNRLTAHLKNI